MIRGFVTDIGFRCGCSPTQIHRLELAVDEACSNVIQHGNLCPPSSTVTVKATYDDVMIRIAIVYAGTSFDPMTSSDTNLDVAKLERGRGSSTLGLGIPMLRSVIDQIDYHVLPDNTNQLELLLRKA